MAGTGLFVLFALIYFICWPINRFLMPTRKLNPGFIFLGIAIVLLANQLVNALSKNMGAEVVGAIVGTWAIPTILGWFISRKFARENAGSIPWGSPKNDIERVQSDMRQSSTDEISTG